MYLWDREIVHLTQSLDPIRPFLLLLLIVGQFITLRKYYLGDEGPAEGGDASTEDGEAGGQVDQEDHGGRGEAHHQQLDNHSADGDQSWNHYNCDIVIGSISFALQQRWVGGN